MFNDTPVGGMFVLFHAFLCVLIPAMSEMLPFFLLGRIQVIVSFPILNYNYFLDKHQCLHPQG